MNAWNILYRGSLSSCNYGCGYCPFAKSSNSIDELRQDEIELARFVAWVGEQHPRDIGILITPWGEALVHRYYRRAMVALSRMPHVRRIAIQTNLAAPIDDLLDADRDALALWTTFHPTQTTLERFAARCRELDAAAIRYSVGVVGLREHFDAIDDLCARLRPDVYLWVNAYKRDPAYYQPGEIERLQTVDPYFHWNLRRYPSRGGRCHAGETSFTVAGDGSMRRCHFVGEIIGNIYEPGFANVLKPRLCPAETCGCHIGYVHRPELELGALYGAGLLERIPADWPTIAPRYGQATSAQG